MLSNHPFFSSNEFYSHVHSSKEIPEIILHFTFHRFFVVSTQCTIFATVMKVKLDAMNTRCFFFFSEQRQAIKNQSNVCFIAASVSMCLLVFDVRFVNWRVQLNTNQYICTRFYDRMIEAYCTLPNFDDTQTHAHTRSERKRVNPKMRDQKLCHFL